MAGGFRDTFTKDSEQEELLGYDDTAFYYFACSVLITIALPWTWSVIKTLIWADADKAAPGKSRHGSKIAYCMTSDMVEKQKLVKKREARCSHIGVGWWVQVVILVIIWTGLFAVSQQLGNEKEINKFDPFEILDVSSSANPGEIKKAYRRLSLVYHPDKNPDDPLAAARFIQITKAYSALTDETAKKNYELYGNPDGPQTTKVGIGLPRFLLEKDNQFIILCFFFGLLLFLVPMTFICYYQRTKDYAANGVLIETLHFLGYKINESTRLKNCPELLAASAESRNMPPRPSDNKDMRPLSDQIVEHKKRQFADHPVIVKSSFLIWAHMQRLHDLMTPELREDCDELLRHSVKITQAMIEIACMREWFFTAQAMIEFRRSLVQGLDVKMSQLLQLPHFDEECVKHCTRGKNSATSLIGFVQRDADQRKGLADMDAQKVADIEEFVLRVPDIELKAGIEVEDEGEIVVGDIATVSVRLTRKNLKEGEAAGPVHAPLFPELKYEEWWLFVIEGQRIVNHERVRNPERVVEARLSFQISRPGKHRLELHCICDSYAGLDKKVELTFNVLHENEVNREIIIHKEDEDLDLQPTLFQQFMGEFAPEEESEEEEDEAPKKKKKPVAKPAAKKETISKREEKAKSDTEDDSTKKGQEESEDSSDSSDSDSD